MSRRSRLRRGIVGELAFVAGVGALSLGAVLWLRWLSGLPFGDLTRDPAGINETPVYVGFLSNIGILLWAAAAAVCLFAVRLLGPGSHPVARRFLLASGAFTLLLTADDLFLLHERVVPNLLGVSELASMAVYGLLGGAYLAFFLPVIRRTRKVLLVLAIVFFGLSIAVDLFHPPVPAYLLVEDGAKLVGIAAWLAYLTRAAQDLVGSQGIGRPAAGGAPPETLRSAPGPPPAPGRSPRGC